jgi:hypothetical protein
MLLFLDTAFQSEHRSMLKKQIIDFQQALSEFAVKFWEINNVDETTVYYLNLNVRYIVLRQGLTNSNPHSH